MRETLKSQKSRGKRHPIVLGFCAMGKGGKEGLKKGKNLRGKKTRSMTHIR